MRKPKTAIWLALAGVLACVLLALGQQLFEGQLQVLDFKAPEFPAPVEPASSLAEENVTNSPAVPPSGEASPQQETGEGRPASAPPSPGATANQPAAALPSNGIYWINSRPLYIHKLRGHVVMLDLWEYTCINCIRTLPTTIEWYNRYRPYGFEVIGVHGPEFRIAYNVDNVRKAVKRLHIPYPVVVDDQFRIFQAYHANAWPVRFLIDAKGVVRYERVGEGGDSAFEDAIRDLLKEAQSGVKLPPKETAASSGNAFAPGCGGDTPEMYVGDWEGRGVLANPEGYEDGKTIDYKLPGSVDDGRFVLAGRWKTDANGMIYAGKRNAEGELEMRYHARELYAVLNVARSRPSRLYITQDGNNLTAANKGQDVQLDGQGRSYVEVRESRMYYLVRNASDSGHVVVLRPAAPGITVNSFTFGNNCQLDFAHL
ncbi:MAG: redoxin domain-containing protein [Terriglobia bacterium]